MDVIQLFPSREVQRSGALSEKVVFIRKKFLYSFKNVLIFARNELFFSNEKISYSSPKKINILAKCFISAVFDRDFEYTHHSFMC